MYEEELKAFSDAEKSLFHSESWVKVKIVKIKDHKVDECEKLWNYDMPVSMLNRWLWYIKYRICRFQSQYLTPHIHITAYYSYYDKQYGIDAGWGSLRSKLIHIKSEVTKAENKMALYKRRAEASLFSNLDEDENYQKAIVKLNQKKAKLSAMINEVQMKIAIENKGYKNVSDEIISCNKLQ